MNKEVVNKLNVIIREHGMQEILVVLPSYFDFHYSEANTKIYNALALARDCYINRNIEKLSSAAAVTALTRETVLELGGYPELAPKKAFTDQDFKNFGKSRMSDDTFYIKNQTPGGRVKYTPVMSSYPKGLPEGAWLLFVRPGSKVTVRSLTPERADVEAAMFEAAEAMVSSMLEQCKEKAPIYRAENEVTQKKAWEAYIAAGGETPMSFRGVSMQDVVDSGINALRKHIEENS